MKLALLRDQVPETGHRPDIDGLRAIAVLGVLLYHLDVTPFGGGFAGVDVFFAISGYLIGGIVLRDLECQTFHLGDFLLRRVRRLVPALLVVLAATLAVGCFLLLPNELAALADSAAAALAFCANLFFWQQGLVYGSDSDSAPLVHLWTLGVEGQFYLAFALLALVLWRTGPRAWWIGMVVLALASVAWGHWHPEFRFYLLPARFWEFALGVLAAVTPLPFLTRRVVREAVGLVGLALVLAAMVMASSESAFPNWHTLLPVGGAVAIMLAGGAGAGLAARLLSLPPLTFVGRISYSFYLWHWAVICLLLLGLPVSELSLPLKLAATALSLALATVSWRFVEQPFRQASFPVRRTLQACGAGALALLLAAGPLHWTGGWQARFDARTLALAGTQDYPLLPSLRAGTCFVDSDTHPFNRQRCLAAMPGQPQVLLVGDSHAAHLWYGLQQLYPDTAIVQVTAGGCRPLIDQPAGIYDKCADLMRWALRDLTRQRHFDLVIMAGAWEDKDLPYVDETLAKLRANKQPVLLLGQFVRWTYYVPRLLAIGQLRGEPGLADKYRDSATSTQSRFLHAAAERHGAQFFDPAAVQCDPHCHYFDAQDDQLLVDDAHLTREGSVWLARFIANPALRGAVTRRPSSPRRS